MPWKRGFIFAVLFSTFFFSQEHKPGADAQARTTASISGTVVQADTHLPLKGVQVTITSNTPDASDSEADSPSDRQITAKTDEKGRFEITGLAPGSYNVQAAHAGMSLKGRSAQQGMLITLEAGKSQTLNLTMLPTGVISGQILNEDGEPMPQVSVVAMRYGYTIMGRHLAQAANATTDDKGQFRLFGLQPGPYLVVANPGGFEGSSTVITETSSSSASSKANAKVYAPTYYPNEISAEHATPILLKPGEETRADFTLARVPAHSITGKVAGLATPKATDKDTPETEFSLVTAMRDGSPMPVAMAVIGKDSSFKFRSLPAGKYSLIAMHMGGDAGNIGSAEVVIDSSDVTGVVIGAESVRREITGVVRAEGETKPDFSKLYIVFSSLTDSDQDANFAIASSFFGGTNGFAQVKSDGSFKAALAPSAKPYNVLVSTRGTGLEDWFTSKVLVGGKDVLESGFKPGEPQSGLEIVLSNKGALIEGTVLDHDQKPFANAEVIAFPRDPKLRRRMDMVQTATADQQGRFKMRGVRPGEYILFALESSQDQPFTTELFLKNNSARTQTVKLEAAAKQQLQLQVIPAQAQ